MVKKLCLGFMLCVCGLLAVEGLDFQPIEKARLRVFESLYSKDLDTIAKQQKFLKDNFKQAQENDIYTFPKVSIENAYNAYALANEDEMFKRELPSTNKAFKKESLDNKNTSLITYVWGKDSKSLVVTSLKLKGEEICTKETLDFSPKGNATILKVNYQQYCFDK
ncbi:hypothetical protein DCO58_02870 [Helicobacter saguini]|uniref:Uncharacterized protein n=1 Tax=Helicobacter saguini TaxID=1548018 RepID=A0A347VS25_9HELI|nr:hypothetical protein [Helicobacter saguini]MWV62679.1 hypothetical protein [Helicobacter saguini]MWV66649.1 hypothetical protein [Helicobacter saguini]MWV68999.1 hypothetical protein [Helicobacter saguini]MWV71447.1 hypothetical protein [Helicobacter saguini]TLD94096.1 hypothetical protein LS64_007230 [Helicobacter saguini]